MRRRRSRTPLRGPVSTCTAIPRPRRVRRSRFSSTRCCSSGSSHRERATVVDVDPGFYVRFADLFQIEGTAGRFMLKQMALRLSSRPASSLIAPRQRSSPTSAVARSWGLSCWRQAHAKARQKGAKANAEARSCALTECRQAALPHCGPSQALSMTGVSRRQGAASGLRRPFVTCSPGSECCDRAAGVWGP